MQSKEHISPTNTNSLHSSPSSVGHGEARIKADFKSTLLQVPNDTPLRFETAERLFRKLAMTAITFTFRLLPFPYPISSKKYVYIIN